MCCSHCRLEADVPDHVQGVRLPHRARGPLGGGHGQQLPLRMFQLLGERIKGQTLVCRGSFPLILTPIKLLLVIGIHRVDFFFQFKFYE